MKKTFIPLILLASIFFGNHLVFAASTPAPTTPTAVTPDGGGCDPESVDNNGGCGASSYCNGAATPAVCAPVSSFNPNATPAATTPASAPSAGTGNTGNFVPLTNLPVLSGLTAAPTLPNFLQQLYKYCVGIAAALAVLQIMRAGIMYMGGDSVTETKQARALIASSLLGLVLVLSPVIVFSIINPKILNLGVRFNLLATTPVPTQQANPSAIDPNNPTNPLNTLQKSTCSEYGTTQWTSVPENKECKDVLNSTSWAGIDSACCSQPAPNGQQCCGQAKAAPTPTPTPTPDQSSLHYFGLGYQNTDPNTHKACVEFYYSPQGYTTPDACAQAQLDKMKLLGASAIARGCADTHTVPGLLVGGNAATLQKLPACTSN